MRISDWSSDVCSSDLFAGTGGGIMKHESATIVGTASNVVDIFVSADRARVSAARHLLDLLTAGASSPAAIEVAREGKRIFRSDERRVGKEWVSTCSSGWSPYT